MNAALFRAIQKALAPGAAASFRQWGSAAAGRRLDVGCGCDSWIAAAPGFTVGVDLDPARLKSYRRSGSATTGIAACATALPFPNHSFDQVWSFGLLHHLSGAQSHAALTEMHRVLNPHGRIFLLDAVLPESIRRRPLAALIRHLDRGRHLRSQTALQRLLEAAGANWTCRRVTYARTGLEALFCTSEPATYAHRQ